MSNQDKLISAGSEPKNRGNRFVILLVVFVGLVFGVSILTFQVRSTEYAYVFRFGNPSRLAKPGLHTKLPWPFEKVWKHDNRARCFLGQIGELEEVFTKDGKNIVISVFVCWKISGGAEEILRYQQRVRTVADAEEKITHLLRTYRSAIIGQYNFDDLININPKLVKIHEVEDRILELMRKLAFNQYGIQITTVGLRHIGLPQTVTKTVFARMRAERESKRAEILARGEAEAQRIRARADSRKRIIIAEAESQAKRIRGEADAKAAEYYEIFKEDPQLAEFLVEIEALKRVADGATLFFNPDMPPFTALKKLQNLTADKDVAPSDPIIVDEEGRAEMVK